MSRSEPSQPPPPPWAGAAGNSPYGHDLPPHAPLPGAPPYPAAPAHPPPPVVRRPARTGFGAALRAAGIWAAVNLAIVLIVQGPPPSAAAAGRSLGGLAVLALLAALGTWLLVRQRPWSFWLLVAVAAPFFWILRVVTALLAA